MTSKYTESAPQYHFTLNFNNCCINNLSVNSEERIHQADQINREEIGSDGLDKGTPLQHTNFIHPDSHRNGFPPQPIDVSNQFSWPNGPLLQLFSSLPHREDDVINAGREDARREDAKKKLPFRVGDAMLGFNGTNEFGSLTLEKALKFLNPTTDAEWDAAVKISETFHGCAEALRLAKTHCQKRNMSYLEYLDVMIKRKLITQNVELGKFKNSYGEKALPIFHAFTLQFQPDKYVELRWKVLCCLSYLHYDHIPKFVIERCVQKLRGKVLKNQQVAKTVVETIIRDLEESNLCNVLDDEIISHEVVLAMFRAASKTTQSSQTSFNPLKVVIKVLASLVYKDLKQPHYYAIMRKLQCHIRAVLKQVEECECLFRDKDCVLIKSFVSHLYQASANLMLREHPEMVTIAEKYLQQALMMTLGKKIVQNFLKTKFNQQTIRKLACLVAARSKEVGEKLDENFFYEFSSNLNFAWSEKEVDFLKHKCGLDFFLISQSMKRCEENQNKIELLKQLQGAGLFLDVSKLRATYLSSKVASILLTWSRAILFKKNKNLGEYPLYEQMASLSLEITKICKQPPYSVPLLTEAHALETLAQIYLAKRKEIVEEKELKQLRESLLRQTAAGEAGYEDGFLKEPQDLIKSLSFQLNYI